MFAVEGNPGWESGISRKTGLSDAEAALGVGQDQQRGPMNTAQIATMLAVLALVTAATTGFLISGFLFSVLRGPAGSSHVLLLMAWRRPSED